MLFGQTSSCYGVHVSWKKITERFMGGVEKVSFCTFAVNFLPAIVQITFLVRFIKNILKTIVLVDTADKPPAYVARRLSDNCDCQVTYFKDVNTICEVVSHVSVL